MISQDTLIVLFNWAGNHPWLADGALVWLFLSFTIANIVRAVYPSSKFAPDDRPALARVLLAVFSPWAKIGEFFFRKIGVEPMPMVRGGY